MAGVLRCAAAAAIGFAISLSVVPSASALETLRVGKAGREGFSFVPAEVGVANGIYQKHGIDLQIAGFPGDARVQQAMAAGAIDIGLGSGPAMAFIAKGAPIEAIAAMTGPPLLFALMVRNDGSVKTPDDLKGRKVGISTVGSVTSWIITEISRRKGWGIDGMEQVPVGDDSTRIAALRTKSIDAAIVNLAVALKFVQSGDGRILLRFTDLLKDFHTHVIFATDSAIAEKPALLREFLNGWFETVAFMHANKANTMAVAQEIMQTDDVTTSGVYDELMPMFSDDGRFNPAALKVLSRSFVEMKMLPSEPDMSRLYTTEFLPKE